MGAWGWLVVGVVAYVLVALFVWALMRAAAEADDAIEREARRERRRAAGLR